MKRNLRVGTVVAGSALSAGLIAGMAVAAFAGDDPPTAAQVKAGDSQREGTVPAEILGTMANGKSYGFWSPRTPDDQRPEFRPVDLADGTKAYLKVSEAYPPIDPAMLASTPAGRELRATYMAAQIKPNDKGEVWAPAYARDGVTVVGRVLISDRQPDIK